MFVPIWVWVATCAGFVALLLLSYFVHVRKAHEPSTREAGAWTAFFVTLAILFGFGLMRVWTHNHGIEFFAGYITEYSLSIDNLFVFVLIMSSFAVPRADQQKVLLFGIGIALILRMAFILLGAAAIEHFSWVFYLFGLFLIVTALKLVFSGGEESEEFKPNVMVRVTRRMLPFTDVYDGARIMTRVDGKRCFTPMLLVMVTVGFTDILFALDSIPAIYGLTSVPYIVFATNAFALLGLVELYFLIGGLLKKLIYLSFGLALILGFIGVKLVLHALGENSLAFVNGGAPVAWAPDIPTWLSLIVIVGILLATTVASLTVSAARRRAEAGRPAR